MQTKPINNKQYRYEQKLFLSVKKKDIHILLRASWWGLRRDSSSTGHSRSWCRAPWRGLECATAVPHSPGRFLSARTKSSLIPQLWCPSDASGTSGKGTNGLNKYYTRHCIINKNYIIPITALSDSDGGDFDLCFLKFCAIKFF